MTDYLAGGSLASGLRAGGRLAQLAVTADPAAPHAAGYPALFLLVVVGSVLPVLPTGALVSAAAVVGWHSSLAVLDLPLVLGVSALAAWVGDVLLYWLAAHVGGRWADQLRAHLDTPRMRSAQRRLSEHGRGVLVVSRLVPAGRVPVMAACLVAGWPVRRFLRADVLAVLAWAASYQAIGILGASLFPEPWQGLVVTLAVVVLIAAAPSLWRRLRGGPEPATRRSDQATAPGPRKPGDRSLSDGAAR